MVSLSGDLTPMQRPSLEWRKGRFGGKIPPEKAQLIRDLLGAGFRQVAIAKRMGVTQQCISRFKTGFRKS